MFRGSIMSTIDQLELDRLLPPYSASCQRFVAEGSRIWRRPGPRGLVRAMELW